VLAAIDIGIRRGGYHQNEQHRDQSKTEGLPDAPQCIRVAYGHSA
jgi:hypothetical protein